MNDPTTTPRLVAALTSFNRRDKTLAALDAFEVAARHAGLAPQAVLVDDASRDGTAQAVGELFPWVEIVHGDGSLFWCRGMHRAVEIARAGAPDFVLWLNDDTLLRPSALRVLLDCHAEVAAGAAALVVGTTIDPADGRRTYGGERQSSRWRPLRFAPVAPAAHPQRCDTMNGNVVLVDAAALQRVGNLDPAYEHAMGDTDYGLRARHAGVPVWLAPGVHGQCSGNPRGGTFADATLPLRERWRQMTSRKGLPPRSWRHFARRHAGPLWPLHFAWPYTRLVVGALLGVRSTR